MATASGSALPWECLQLVAERSCLSGCRGCGFLRGGDRLVAGVGHSVQARLRFPSANQEVHGAVGGIDHHVRQRERRAGDKLFQLAGIRAPLGLQVQCVQLAVAPIAQIESLLVLAGNFAP